jgi:hypothetical protein
VTRHTPIVTFKDQTEKLHAVIEKTSAEQYAEKNYQSLSFGDLKVYKPEAFVQLDSMYSIKKAYMDNDDLRGLERSGLEDLIPGYRAAAQEKIHEVQYEIEHLFQTSNENNITIYHSYFLFDYQDSLISVTPFYNFQIPKKSKATYYAYQFDYHFVTNRDLYISKDELNFIQFFKQREVALIGDESLQPFMKHTMKVMEAARKVQTIDFRQIAKQLAVDDFKLIGQDIVIKKIGSLFAIEENEIVRGYELEIEWLDELTKYKITTFTFSPYLEIIDIKTKFK